MRSMRLLPRRGILAVLLALCAGPSCTSTLVLPPAAGLPPEPLPAYALRRELVATTVLVIADGVEPDDSGIAFSRGVATGVIVGREGPLVLTAYHAVRHARSVSIRLLYYDVDAVAETDDIPMRVARSSEDADIALLETVDRRLSLYALPAAHGPPAAGEPVWFYGAASAEVAGAARRSPVIPRHGLLAVAARSRPGDSGAPLVNGSGELLGILVMGSDRRGESYFVPIGAALKALDLQSSD